MGVMDVARAAGGAVDSVRDRGEGTVWWVGAGGNVGADHGNPRVRGEEITGTS
ncbi:MAG: hypothetical protein LC749_03770 [Actinobacteria bacterium]|nr:hypothetical protein [Actinomycetota bacterium]